MTSCKINDKVLEFLIHKDFKTKLKHQNLFIYINIPSTKDQTIHIMIQLGQVFRY